MSIFGQEIGPILNKSCVIILKTKYKLEKYIKSEQSQIVRFNCKHWANTLLWFGHFYNKLKRVTRKNNVYCEPIS